MKKFHFRLQRVLDTRRNWEDRLKQAFASAERIAMREEERLVTYMEEQESTQGQLVRARQISIDPVIENRFVTYFTQLAEWIKHQERAVEHTKEAAERKRQELIRCSQDRKALEKLREKALVRYRLEQDREEIKELDEIGRNGFIRSARSAH